MRFHSDSWALAEALGVSVWRRRLPGRLRELYVNDRDFAVVVLAERLDPGSARELLAHGLGHHLLHVPADPARRRVVGTSAEEREADHFAACFLIPRQKLARLAGGAGPLSATELAERFGVDRAIVAARIAAAQRELRLTALYGVE